MRYLGVMWPPGLPSLVARAHLRTLEPDWSVVSDESGVAVLRPHDCDLEVHRSRNGAAIIIGEVHDRLAAEEGELAPFRLDRFEQGASLESMAHQLTADGWGRYVALLQTAQGGSGVVRDPTGAVEAVFWMRGDIAFVASELPLEPSIWPEAMAVDERRLHRLLVDRDMAAEISPLSGVEVLEPGMLRTGKGLRERTLLWSPQDFASRTRWRPDAEGRLRHVLDASCRAAARHKGGLLCEISGGLDSALVATTMARVGMSVSGVNMAWPTPEGDERPFAQLVAEASRAPLITFERSLTRFDAGSLEETAGGARPSLNAVDPEHDRLMARAAKDVGASTILTGQGGDGLFFQMPSPELASDIVRGGAGPRGRLSALSDLSFRTRRSLWSLAREALPHAHRPWRRHPSSIVAAPVEPAVIHPWLTGKGVSKAKQLQIRVLIHNRKVVGDSRRGRRARIIHPLLSQPMLETCLRLPAAQLAAGRIDRALARAAFADRLPNTIRERRSKGDTTAFYPRSLAASLPFVRDYLLGGELARMCLLDIARLDAALRIERMIHDCPAGEIITALHVEAWARVWRRRLEVKTQPERPL